MFNDCNVLLGYEEPLRVCAEKRKDTFKTREIIQVLNETTKKGAALSNLKSKLKNRHT
jgi:hypothetical protein